MPNLLFILQQWLSPVGAIWPLWLIVFLLYVASQKIPQVSFLRKVALLLGISIFVLLLVVRGVLLFAFPYQDREQELLVSEAQQILPLRVEFRYGDFKVAHTSSLSDRSVYSSYDVSNGFLFDKGTYQRMNEAGKSDRVEAQYLRLPSRASLITKSWSKGTLLIPSTSQSREEYALYESNATLDFGLSASPEVNIDLFYTDATILFPKTPGDKRFVIHGGSRQSCLFEIPKTSPRYEIIDKHGIVDTFPAEFTKKSDFVYVREGDLEGTVVIDITLTNRQALAVRIANE